MEDLSELIETVKNDPENHNQRWRLSKKLYASWEYRIALDHLKILKEAWPNQQNVIHYLATTYYRLGNYDAAISELRGLLDVYPSDASVWRLLGRICESANRPSDAKKAYREAMICSPSTSLAKAVERLDGVTEMKSSIAEVTAYDEVAPDKTQITCRYCGSPNDAFLERCIQCKESLSSEKQAQAPAYKGYLDDDDDLELATPGLSKITLIGSIVGLVVLGALAFLLTR